MSRSSSFSREMARLSDGHPEAAAALFDRYARRLVGLVRARLDDRLRTKLDPEDVMQSVFRTFFRRHADRGFELDNWDGLWALLAQIACRKCGRQWEFYFSEKRDLRRGAASGERGSVVPDDFVTAEPTPAEAAALSELLELLFRERPPRSRRVVEMRLQGYTVPEIAREVGCTERTVFRVLGELRADLERFLEPMPGDS